MHPLETFAETAERITKKWEDQKETKPEKQSFGRRGSSGTHDLINSVCNLCFKEGVGLPAELSTFFKENKINPTVISPLIGNRFHILLRNAGAVYYLQHHIQAFFTRHWTPSNNLHTAVLNYLQINI